MSLVVPFGQEVLWATLRREIDHHLSACLTANYVLDKGPLGFFRAIVANKGADAILNSDMSISIEMVRVGVGTFKDRLVHFIKLIK